MAQMQHILPAVTAIISGLLLGWYSFYFLVGGIGAYTEFAITRFYTDLFIAAIVFLVSITLLFSHTLSLPKYRVLRIALVVISLMGMVFALRSL